MKLNTTVKPVLLLFAFLVLSSHNLYVKMDAYFLQPNQEATLSLYNGTFENSENIISRDRMLDASFVAQGKRLPVDSTRWRDQDSTITQLTFNTGEAGTYVAGVSTRARTIELSAEKFNDYLKHDGVLDRLEYRTNNDLLTQDAVESYQKHVKAIYQVGDTKTDDWKTVLGYPIEFVPKANPYDKYSGEKLEVQLLLDGKPLAEQLVYADYIGTKHAHTHEHEEAETHVHASGQQLRTDTQGIVSVELPEDGIYYLRTIHMTSVNDASELTHQSRWATLTFEVTHKHDETTHTHGDHDHEDEGIPTWLFVVSSLVIIGVLFFIFSKNK